MPNNNPRFPHKTHKYIHPTKTTNKTNSKELSFPFSKQKPVKIINNHGQVQPVEEITDMHEVDS